MSKKKNLVRQNKSNEIHIDKIKTIFCVTLTIEDSIMDVFYIRILIIANIFSVREITRAGLLILLYLSLCPLKRFSLPVRKDLRTTELFPMILYAVQLSGEIG